MADYRAECIVEARAELGECPIWSTDEQCLYWLDIDGKRLNRYVPASGETGGWALPDTPGCFVLAEDGTMVIAMRGGIHRFDPATGQCRKLHDAPYDSAKFRFNDGRTDRQGRLWAGSLYAEIGSSMPATGAYYSYDGSRLVEHFGGVELANGTAFSVDGRTMYRAESLQRTIFAYDLDPASGTVSNQRIFATVPDHLGFPDGAAIDSEDGYWAALPGCPAGGGHVARFTPAGKLDLLVELPVMGGTMPGFGGADMKTLYITTAQLEPVVGKPIAPLSGGLFAVDVPFAGAPETKFRVR